MIIEKGQKLRIRHERKGTFVCKAAERCNTEVDEWIKIILCHAIEGLATNWKEGEKLSIRTDLIRIIEMI